MVFRIRPVSTPAEIKLGQFLIISARTKYPIIVSCVRYSDCRRQRRPIFSNAQKQCVVPPHPAVSRCRSWMPLWRRVVVLLPSVARMVRSAIAPESSLINLLNGDNTGTMRAYRTASPLSSYNHNCSFKLSSLDIITYRAVF